MQLSFTKLPLIEATLRLAPAEPVLLEIPRLASAVLDLRLLGFDQCEPSSEYLVPPGTLPRFSLALNTLPGLRFSDPVKGFVFVLQQDLLLLSWQNQQLDVSLEYPRFHGLLSRLRNTLDALLETGLPFDRFRALNISYRDFVATPEAPRVQDVLHYLRECAVPALPESSARFHESGLSWRNSRETDLRLAIQGISPGGPGQQSGFSLTSVGGRLIPAMEWPETIFEEVHEDLLELFEGILTDNAREEWGYATNA